ncbi:Uncharacterised protein [Mycobacteroides abscessus subsp. abscessus]|uniref:hypothetical protein n=1 Tax=Mycobacteroides abscessus TaxID=36809 RepID=UPI00092C56AE|nr:hypothetical protein [Mycobacteroides abscessus]SIH22198.1 Uncharacterised protein [Mycobacteroides abscessus subsp. abscessus]
MTALHANKIEVRCTTIDPLSNDNTPCGRRASYHCPHCGKDFCGTHKRLRWAHRQECNLAQWTASRRRGLR